VKKQPTTLWTAGDRRGSSSITADRTHLTRRNGCYAEMSSNAASVTRVAPTKRNVIAGGKLDQRPPKKLCQALDSISQQKRRSVKVGKERLENSAQAERGKLTKGSNVRTHSILSGFQKRGQYNFSSTSQLVGEDIQCDVGLAFLFLDADSEGLDEHEAQWLGRFADRPGVTQWEPNSKKRARKASLPETKATLSRKKSSSALYRSRISYEGVSINLGNHKSSVAAAAAQDLANLALFGSDHKKDRHVLTRDEAWKALIAVMMPGAGPCGRVEEFCSLLTVERKAMFEQKIEEALSAIGGNDDHFADILSGVDHDAFSAAKEIDEATEVRRREDAKIAEKKERARKMRRARRRDKANQRRLEKARSSARKRSRVMPVSRDGFVFGDEHGMYGINEMGRFFWTREMSSGSALHTHETLASHFTLGESALAAQSSDHSRSNIFMDEAEERSLSPIAHSRPEQADNPILMISSESVNEEQTPEPGRERREHEKSAVFYGKRADRDRSGQICRRIAAPSS